MTHTLTPTPADVRPRRPWVKVLLALIIAGIVAMWVYAFAFAPRKGVYRVDSAQWRSDARRICQAAADERVALADTAGGFIEHPTAADMLRRADIVDQATDILERMLDELVALPLDTVRDRQLVDVWAGYYRTLIADRRQYTANLRNLDNKPFREQLVHGGPVSDVLTDFTSGNGITACAPPGELG